MLDNIALRTARGDHIAISGSNGSGKSTLANILTAIYGEYGGTVFYNGIDYRQIDPHEIRNHICLIPAHPELFAGTVYENLVLGRDRPIPERVRSILEEKNLPLELVIQEGGSNLSSGEAKILQLLRGICSDSDCYIIDEPLNYIDDKYVEMVLGVMESLFYKKTVVIISHDRRAFQMCSKHYTLHNRTLIQNP